MSIELMSRVWKCDLPPNRTLVLLAMADIARDDGSRCYPSIDFLAWKCNYSRRQIQRTIQELRAMGVLLVIAHDEGGRGNATEYLIKLDHLEHKTAWEIVRVSAQIKGDNMTPLMNRKGDIHDEKGCHAAQTKGDIQDTKGRHMRHERVTPTSPHTLLNINNSLSDSLSDSREENKDEETPESSFWNRVLTDLRSQITRPSFETWLTSTHCIQLSPNVATIKVASTIVRDMLNERMYSLISIACSKIPPHPSEVLFEVMRPQELEESL